MQKITILACLTLCLAACNSGDTANDDSSEKTDSATATQPGPDGWIALFDGKSTAGWHRYGGGAAPAWKIADGVLYLDTTQKKNGKVVGGGDLVTDEEFDNFHLKLDWKIAPGGNSGIIFYLYEDSVKYKNSWETGLEMQVVDNEGHSDGKIVKHKAGDLYDLIPSSKDAAKPAGEWNHAEIKSLNGQLELYLNGEQVVSTALWDDNWKLLVAGSKFKTMPAFGTYKKGKIALQDHDNMVSYRNIEIKKL